VRTLKIKMTAAVVTLVAVGAIVVAGIGAGSAPASQPLHRHHCIPQHNRGDHDRDNRGGPSDGDGCM
jgi:hypothetical protein